jgi:hypothetical protein
MAFCWSSALHFSMRQQLMAEMKPVLAQMQAMSTLQLPMPLVRKMFAQAC